MKYLFSMVKQCVRKGGVTPAGFPMCGALGVVLLCVGMMDCIPVHAQLPTLVERQLPVAFSELPFESDSSVAMVVHAGAHCLALNDVNAVQVACLNLTSGAARRFGMKGSGPGEFAQITAMTPDVDGGILVADGRSNRLTTISKNWTLGRMTPLSFRPATLFRATGDSVLTLGGLHGFDLVAVSRITGLGTPKFSPGHADSALFEIPAFKSWGFLLQARPGGGWLVAAFTNNTILALDDLGRKVYVASRVLPPVYPTAAEKEAWVNLLLRLNPAMSPEQRAAISSHAEEYAKTPKPTAMRQGFGEDPSGRLWVITSRIVSDSTELDVYSREGHFLGTRRVAGFAQALSFVGADLFVMSRSVQGERAGMEGIRRFTVR